MVAPVVGRELRITYGATVVGGASSYQLDAGDDGRDRLVIDRTAELTIVEFHVVTADHDDDQPFAAACAELELAFTRPRQRLLIEQGPGLDVPLLDLDPAEDTGIEVRSQIRKVGGPHDTGRSRRYFVRITSGNPANQTAAIEGEAGLRSFRSRIVWLPSRVGELQVSGTYTKLGDNTAEEQYLDQIDARAGAIIEHLTGLWELADESYEPNLEDSLIEFSRTYEEVTLRQSLSVALDDPNVAKQRLTVAIEEEAPGDSGADVLRLVAVNVSYEAWVKKDVGDLKAWWANNGLPWVVAHAQATAQASGMALVGRKVDLDARTYLVRAALRFLAATGGSVLARQVTTVDMRKLGKVFVPVWNGDPLAAYVFQGPEEYFRTITVAQTVLGNVAPATPRGRRGARPGGSALGVFGIGAGLSLDFGGGGIFGLGQELSLEFLGPGGGGAAGAAAGAAAAAAGGGPSFELVETRDSYTPKTLGLPGYQLAVTDLVRTTVERLVNRVAANQGTGGVTTGGAGGGAGSTRTRGARPGGAQ